MYLLDVIDSERTNTVSLNQVDEDILLSQAKLPGEIGRIAIQNLIYKNIGLILFVQGKYLSHISPTYDRDDLLSTAIIGFIRAAQLFNPEVGVKFSTYAGQSMHFQILRAIETESISLRIPVILQRERIRINKVIDSFLIERGRKPSIEELSRLCIIPVSKIKSILSLPSAEISIDAPLHSDTEDTLGDLLPDANHLCIYNKIDRDDLISFLEEHLSDIQFKILSMHYGLFPKYVGGFSLAQIAKKLGVSTHWVKKIHISSIKILMKPQNQDYLFSLLSE